MSYELTCRTPEDLEAAAEEYAGGALYSLSVNAWNGARVVVYTALPDEEADPEREAAKERRDAMAQRVEDMVHSVCAFIVPKLMRPTAGTELRNCMEEAAKEWLGPRGSQWSKGAMASRWLDEAEWEGARPDGSASGMVAACIARDWLATAEPNRTVLGMACGLDEMSDYGRDQLAHLLDAMGAAAGDGWEPSREDMALMAELSAACKEDESEEL